MKPYWNVGSTRQNEGKAMTPTRDDVRIRLLAEVVQPLLGPADSADEQTVIDDILRIVGECGFVPSPPVTCPNPKCKNGSVRVHDGYSSEWENCPTCDGKGSVPNPDLVL